MTNTSQTPLLDLLRDIPVDARMTIQNAPYDHSFIPIGRMAREAADEIAALRTENAALTGRFTEIAPCDTGDMPMLIAARAVARFREVSAERDALREELERERIRLAACGVAALSNTATSATDQRLPVDSPYYSDSYAQVCRAVDAEIALRRERDALQADAARYRWLRNGQNEHRLSVNWNIGHDWIGVHFEQLDAAIDEAMK